MLVKFLSYVATIIGNGRWKPILLTFGAIILSVGSVSVVASVLHSDSSNLSSKVNQPPTDGNQQSSDTPQISDTQKTAKPDANQTPAQNNQPNTNTTKPTTDDTADKAFDITPKNAAVAVAPGNTSATMTLATSDGTTGNWAITDTNVPGVTILLDQPRDNVASVNLRFRADSTAAIGTYQYTLTIKDTNRNTTATKVVALTVAQ